MHSGVGSGRCTWATASVRRISPSLRWTRDRAQSGTHKTRARLRPSPCRVTMSLRTERRRPRWVSVPLVLERRALRRLVSSTIRARAQRRRRRASSGEQVGLRAPRFPVCKTDATKPPGRSRTSICLLASLARLCVLQTTRTNERWARDEARVRVAVVVL